MKIDTLLYNIMHWLIWLTFILCLIIIFKSSNPLWLLIVAAASKFDFKERKNKQQND